MAFEDGGAVAWVDPQGTRLIRFGEADLHRPLLCFLRPGWLVAVDKSLMEVYQTSDRQLALHAAMPFESPGRPIAVIPHRRRDQFAVVFENGQVLICEMAG